MFKNQYQPNRQMYKEYALKMVCHSYFIRSCILLLVALITFLMSYKRYHVIASVELLAGMIVLFSMIVMPDMVTRQLLDEQSANGLPLCTIIFDDHVTIRMPKQVTSVEYSQISQAYELKSCYVIKINDRDFLIKKGCFVEGDETAFPAFLIGRCPQLTHFIRK